MIKIHKLYKKRRKKSKTNIFKDSTKGQDSKKNNVKTIKHKNTKIYKKNTKNRKKSKKGKSGHRDRHKKGQFTQKMKKL
jgi:hypothetical protein